MSERFIFAIGAFLLRISLGLLYFVAGLTKVMGGAAAASQGIEKMFTGTWLPAWSVHLFALTLPYAETAIGALLILGLLRVVALPLGGLLMVSLAFGMMVAGKHDVVANNMGYVFMFAAACFAMRWDVIALDELFFRRRAPAPVMRAQ